MEFRLVYDGWLPPASQNNSRNKEKHDIRRKFSGQLQVLWETHPRLQRHKIPGIAYGMGPLVYGDAPETRDMAFFQHPDPAVFRRCDREFVPLVTNQHGVACALDILFMRRDPPGGLIKSGGDIDNRIKVLFDALRMPAHDSEVWGGPEDEPKPFYCLLEDDRLITDVRVTTDRLLVPRASDEHQHEVRLIVHVRTVVIDPSNLGAVTLTRLV